MIKKRSKIISDLIMDKIDVLKAMQSLDFMLEDVNDSEIQKWVKNELNGYKKKDEIPQYREVQTLLIGDIQVGYGLFKNVNIPVIDKDAINMFSKTKIIEPLSTIIQMAKAENEIEGHSLSLEVNTILVNHYQQTNGEVITARRKLGIYTYNNIVSNIKTKLLEIFKLLEKKYGNLDELYIDFSDNSKKDKVVKEMVEIIYYDNSINMGNNKEIRNSKVGGHDGN